MSRKPFYATLGILVAVIIALIGMEKALDNEKTWDVSYGMANTNVSWQQTYYPGPWDMVE